MKYAYYYDSPLGRLYVAETSGAITDVKFHPIADAAEMETPLVARAICELREYFGGRLKTFDLPLCLVGTEFQKKAWNALLAIPYGETRTYKEQAAAVGNPKACRAVGAANGRNPISIIVPCHRVIGSDNTLIGYGDGLEIKRALLAIEYVSGQLAVSNH